MLQDIRLYASISSFELKSVAVSDGRKFVRGYSTIWPAIRLRFMIPSMSSNLKSLWFPMASHEQIRFVLKPPQVKPKTEDDHVFFTIFLGLQPGLKSDKLGMPKNIDVSDINTYKG